MQRPSLFYRGVKKLFVLTTVFNLVFTGQASAQSTANVNANGANGSDASNGSGYGGNAGPSSRGQNAKDAVINLAEILSGSSTKAVIQLTGKIVSSQSGNGAGNGTAVENRVILNSDTKIHISALGGTGGDGGVGADGYDGRDGSDGRDATRSSNGTNGERGQDGGPAGAGSAGSDGGRGGNVKVFVPVEDIHLALLVQCDVSGGSGGRGGRHGHPGSGGRGGSGGSGYSWTEKTGESCSSSTRDNGNGSYSVERSCSPTYTSYSNSGGSSGSRGSDGSSAHGNTSAGSPGRNGSCTYATQDGSQLYQGSQIFNVQVQSYDLTDENNNGIFEPLEKVIVSNIKIKNTGDLPSPSNKAQFKISINATTSTQASGQFFIAPRLNPGQSYVFPETLKFTINNDSNIGINQRYLLPQPISPNSFVTRVDRAQPNFELTKNIIITYPIEISPVSMADSAGPGQTIPIFWKIKNISGRDFGGESELKRALQTNLATSGGDAKSNLFTFVNSAGKSTLLTQKYANQILNLKAGQEIIVSGNLQIDAQALPYTQLKLTADLWIDDFVGNQKVIQKNQHQLRISALYQYNPDSEYLLITNQNLERAEFLAWQQAIKSVGAKADIWDLSYYGALNLKKALTEANGKAMNDILAAKTIIALNNEDATINGQAVSTRDLVNLLSQKQANIIYIGGDVDEMTTAYKDLLQLPIESAESGRSSWSETISSGYNRLAFWSGPSEADLKAEVQKRAMALLKKDPKQRFFMNYNFNSKPKEGSFFTRMYQLGNVSAIRTITPGGGRAVFLPFSPEEMKSTDKITSEETLRALILPTSFKFKVSALSQSASLAPDARRYLRDSIVYDLILEMDLNDLAVSVLPDTLVNEDKLAQYVTALQKQGALSVEDTWIVAGVLSYSDELGQRKIKNQASQIIGLLAKDNEIKNNVNLISKEVKRRKKLLPSFSSRDVVRSYLSWPAVDRSITTDLLLRDGQIIQGDN